MSEQCNNMASVRRFWPGQVPDVVCADHAQDSNSIAQAMGFYLHLEPIGYNLSSPIKEFPKCCCDEGFSQKTLV